MKWGSKSWRSLIAISLVVLMLVPAALFGAERQKRMKPREFNPADKTVEMFEAIEADQIEVRLIPKDSTESRILVKNKTDKPLNIKMPKAFAGMPILAQGGRGFGGGGAFGGGGGRRGGGGGGRRGGRGGSSRSGGSQSVGGGTRGGGMFNIPAEAVGDVKVATVCLEHGKKDPSPKVPYQIRPIESFSDKKEVKILCQMLAEGEVTQRSAQAAAWHLSSDMSWEELAAEKNKRANGDTEPYFQSQEIQLGMEIADEIQKRIKQTKSSQPTESLSDR